MKRVIVTKVDDIDGSTEDVETVKFGLGSRSYEIDLSPANHRELREQIQKWVKHARRVKKTPAADKPETGTTPPAVVRAWALANGYQIGDRGRVSKRIETAYRKAMLGESA